MKSCHTCGTPLPDSDPECGHCRLKFFEESAEASFLDDDDEAEFDAAPAPRRRSFPTSEPVVDVPFLADDEDEWDEEEDFETVETRPAAPVAAEPVTPSDVNAPVEHEAPVEYEDPSEAEEPLVAPEPVAMQPVEPAEFADEREQDEPIVTEPLIAEPVVMEPVSVEPTVVEPIAHPVVQPVAAAAEFPAFLTKQPLIRDEDLPVVRPTLTEGLEISLSTRLEVHSAPAEGCPVVHALLDIDPIGAPLVASTDGPVAHVILALDVSASMNSPDKYPVLTRALENMLNDLQFASDGEVLISLIVFAYGAEVLLRAAPASELTAREVLRLIDASPLRFGRYTDLNGALSRAGRIAYDSHRALPRMPLRAYVLTDGKPQDMEAARKTMQLIQKLPVDVNGLAFGNDADVDSLQQLISGGRGGTVKHVRPDTLSSAFERIAEVARHVVAKRALLDVELRSGVVGGAAYRFRPGRFAYGENAFQAGSRFSTDLGTLETGRRYSMLFQLRLPAARGDETELARITLRVPGEGGPRTFEALVSIPRHSGTAMPEPEVAVIEARHIVEAEGVTDPRAQLKALKARHRLYTEERRDPYVIELLDRAIAELETKGSLDALSNSEKAVLQSHTQSVMAGGPKTGAMA